MVRTHYSGHDMAKPQVTGEPSPTPPQSREPAALAARHVRGPPPTPWTHLCLDQPAPQLHVYLLCFCSARNCSILPSARAAK